MGIREAKTGQMMNREWSRAELEQSAPWLKRMNAKGNDVYVRPAGAHGLVLVDDVKPAMLEKMRRDGFAPAAAIETSPGNYQAWVKLSDKPLSADVRRVAAQALAKHYDGDPNSADSRHYGRLAGFTNQKPQHAKDGRQPYVLAHDCPGKPAERAQALLETVGQGLARVEAEKARSARLEALEGYKFAGAWLVQRPQPRIPAPGQRLMERYGKTADFSRLDWMIATDMAKSGRFSAQGIAGAIEKHSPRWPPARLATSRTTPSARQKRHGQRRRCRPTGRSSRQSRRGERSATAAPAWALNLPAPRGSVYLERGGKIVHFFDSQHTNVADGCLKITHVSGLVAARPRHTLRR